MSVSSSIKDFVVTPSSEVLFFAAYPSVDRYLETKERRLIARISKLWNQVVKEGSLCSLLIHSSLNFGSPLAPFMVTNFPYIEECSCVHAPEHKRAHITNTLITKLGEFDQGSFGKKTFVVQSIGCGGCLRELILTIYLRELGIQNVHLILIDPCIGIMESNWLSRQRLSSQKKPNLEKTVVNLQQFFKLFLPDLAVSLEFHKCSVEEYLHNRKIEFRPDILLMIDVDFLNVLQKSYELCLKADALKETTLLGWTRFKKLNTEEADYHISAHVASVRDQGKNL